MKRIRSLAAILLSLTMMLLLAVPAFAAGAYSITIQKDKEGHTYEAYQIFAGDVSSDEVQGGNAEGPILSNIIWGRGVDKTQYAALLAALKADATIGAKFIGINDAADAAAIAAALDGATAADAAAFANVVSGFLSGTLTQSTYNGGVYTIGGLDSGYYLVKDQNGSLEGDADTATEYIVQVLGNVTMEPKDSDIPTVEKKVSEEDYRLDDGYGYTYNDVADWDIGDSVPFKLIGSIPDMSAYDTYEYIFTDTLSDGLTLETDRINVYIAINKNDEVREYVPLTEGEDYTLNTDNVGANGGGSFTISFDDLKTAPFVNEENRKYVIVTYDATLNANAEIGLPGNPNSVDLQFSNNPNGDGLGRTAEDTVIVFTYELDGTKVDGENAEKMLRDAQFVLLNGGHTQVARIENGKLAGWVDFPGGYDNTNYAEIPYETWTEFNKAMNVIMTSDAEGAFGVAGLEDGTYYLMEIQAPDGYNLLEHDLEVTITATTANGQNWNGVANTALTALAVQTQLGETAPVDGTGNVETGAVGIQVTNNHGATLPETGGMGTTLFYVIGSLLVAGAGILLVVRFRMGASNKE